MGFDAPIHTVSQLYYGPDYDVSSDGRRFLFNLGAESAQASFVVLLGWQRSLFTAP